MDKQTAIINHRHMWNWLSKNPGAEKLDYLRTHNVMPVPRAQCFLCEHQVGCAGGKECLLIWPPNRAGKQNCTNGGLWSKWEQETDVTRRTELARQIRDLPERGKKRFRGFAGTAFEAHVEGLGISKTVVVVDPATTATEIRMRQEAGRTWMDKVTHPETPPPPPKLTRAEAIAKTREQWRWLGQHPKLEKPDYFQEKGIKDSPVYGCYLCQWTGENTDAEIPSLECGGECPLTWPGGWCEAQNGLHKMWCEVTYKGNRRLRASIAYLIARLPEKEAPIP